jgi:hypothetical protein
VIDEIESHVLDMKLCKPIQHCFDTRVAKLGELDGL